jgi:F-type H+-transporting ATPase subunit epsilon
MKCIVVTPEKTALNVDTTFVVMPFVDGEYGVLPGHAPLIGGLGAGELRVTEPDGQLIIYYVEGGFAEILDDTIALMTMVAIPEQDLDLAAAEKELAEAEAVPADSPAHFTYRNDQLNLHRAKVRLAQKLAGK